MDAQTFLWVERSVCDRLATRQFFVDLLALADDVNAQKAVLTGVAPNWSTTLDSLTRAISPRYEVESEVYSPNPKSRDNALLCSYMRSSMKLLHWIDAAETHTSVAIVAESQAFIPVLEEIKAHWMHLTVYTDTPEIVLSVTNMEKDGFNVEWRKLDLLPQRRPRPNGRPARIEY
jgi:hypothetical protein